MMTRIQQENVIQKKAKESCIISDKIDFLPESVISDRKSIYH